MVRSFGSESTFRSLRACRVRASYDNQQRACFTSQVPSAIPPRESLAHLIIHRAELILWLPRPSITPEALERDSTTTAQHAGSAAGDLLGLSGGTANQASPFLILDSCDDMEMFSWNKAIERGVIYGFGEVTGGLVRWSYSTRDPQANSAGSSPAGCRSFRFRFRHLDRTGFRLSAGIRFRSIFFLRPARRVCCRAWKTSYSLSHPAACRRCIRREQHTCPPLPGIRWDKHMHPMGRAYMSFRLETLLRLKPSNFKGRRGT